ncbi:MAG: hypothetical protein JJE21_02165 [Spirochaetaceae bacterium]|nr:hypothetical protein [Spirochaetaceae bacterium]
MKTAELKVRLTELEKGLLKEKATALNMTLSDYVKWCCLINPPKSSGMN